MLKLAAMLAIGLSLAPVASAGPRNWQDATIISMGTGEGPIVAAPVGGMWVAGRIQWIHYVVETADLRYDLATRKNLNVTIRKTTRLATDGKNAFLIDDDGKERKLHIVAKIAKQASPPPTPSPTPTP